MFVTAGGRHASTADLFDALAASYDQTGVAFFGPVAGGLLDLAAARSGERVLDIGCGRGAATLPLSQAVGRSGRVTAVDLSPKMVAATRALVARKRLGNVEVIVGDAQRLRVGRGFDLVVASLVLPLMDSTGAALGHWLELLRPGGRLALSTVDAVDATTEQLDRAFDRWVRTAGPPPRSSALQPYDGVRLRTQLRQGGAVDVTSVTDSVVLEFSDVEDWQRFSMSTAQRLLWRRVPLGEQPAFLGRVAQVLEEARGEDGLIRLRWDVRHSLARLPAG
ncbi:MAG TPA: methyltransferase domain-containing protein [Marmoricola sp.]|nr:methyltransferase domain-containing protein [Marmoricola sp.]